MSIQQSHPQEQAPQRRSLDQSVENLTTGSRMQRQPEVFLKVFQLGLRDLGVGILPLLLRSIAPFEIDSKIISSYLLLLWKTKMRKDTNLQKKVYYNIQYFPFQRNFRQQSSSKSIIKQAGPLSNSKKIL